MGQRADLDPNEWKTEEIRSDIQKTRAEVGQTIDQLRERLSAEHVKNEMGTKIKNATVGRARNLAKNSTERVKDMGSRAADRMKEMGGNAAERMKDMGAIAAERMKDMGANAAETLRENVVTRTIIENPVPAVLAGVGLGWIIYKASAGKANGRTVAFESDEFQEYPETGETEGIGTRTRDKAREMADRAKERTGELAEHARQKTGEFMGQLREKASEVRIRTRDGAEKIRSRYTDLLENNPLLLIGAVAALGMVIGFLLPETRREHQLMGEAKGRLFHKAKGAAQETYEKVERVAQGAKRTAEEEARKEGLLS